VSPGALLGAAIALGLERACYVWIARAPASFRRACAHPAVSWIGEPIAVVRALFCAFKVLQASVFVWWCRIHGGGSLAPAPADALATVLGGALVLIGQALNLAVFYRLGSVAVFYGDRLGHDVPWCRDFPFSVLAHPQYVGAVLTIWGVFLILRFPHPDWFLLPVLETMYYAAGTWVEARGAVGTNAS
jgi:methylene-fatty-acyl-phospholipid synthase